MFKNFSLKESFSGFRLLARITDYCLFYVLIAFSTSLLPYFLEMVFCIGLIFAVPLLWIPVEALLISRYGTTPGKSLFGMRVSGRGGNTLSFSAALRRAAFLSPRPGVLVQKKLRPRQRLIAMALFCGAVFVALFGKPLTYYSIGLDVRNTAGWMQYYSLTRGFTVNFPSDPKEQSKQLEIPNSGKVLNYEEISSQQTKDVLYSVSYMELPSKWRWAGSNTLLKGALDLLVKYSPKQMEIFKREIISYQNHRALDFHLREGDNHVRGRFILVDNTLYKLTVVFPPSLNAEIENGSPFLDSFDLHPKGIKSDS